MKRTVVLAIFLALGISKKGLAQCNPDFHTSECIPQLSEGFNFLKGYKIDGKGGEKDKIEFSYVFTKGTQYMINICSSVQPGIIINLFDSRRNQVASSEINGQFAKAIAFPCKATGIYYISYSFSESSDFCGGSALGFRRS